MSERLADVRFWRKADIGRARPEWPLWRKVDIRETGPEWPLLTQSGH